MSIIHCPQCGLIWNQQDQLDLCEKRDHEHYLLDELIYKDQYKVILNINWNNNAKDELDHWEEVYTYAANIKDSEVMRAIEKVLPKLMRNSGEEF